MFFFAIYSRSNTQDVLFLYIILAIHHIFNTMVFDFSNITWLAHSSYFNDFLVFRFLGSIDFQLLV